MRPQIDQLAPWIELRFDRAAGPGGQNVNKLNTRVTLLFDFAACAHLSEQDKTLIQRRCAKRLARDGRLRIVAQGERSQTRNRAAAEHRLLELLDVALRLAAPRRPTRPTAAARQRRLNAKRQRSRTKQMRADNSPPDG